MDKRMKAEMFFTTGEKQKIKETIADIETRTIGEVAVMVVGSSDRYIEAEVVGGVLLGSLLSLALTLLIFNWNPSVWEYIPLSFILFFPSRILFKKVPILKNPFIGLRRKEQSVIERAERAFFERGLYKTRDESGVLFFISLFERKLRILADKGIYEKIHQNTLDEFAVIVTKGIKEGRPCEALIEAMQAVGVELAKHYPKTKEDVDELSDEIITG